MRLAFGLLTYRVVPFWALDGTKREACSSRWGFTDLPKHRQTQTRDAIMACLLVQCAACHSWQRVTDTHEDRMCSITKWQRWSIRPNILVSTHCSSPARLFLAMYGVQTIRVLLTCFEGGRKWWQEQTLSIIFLVVFSNVAGLHMTAWLSLHPFFLFNGIYCAFLEWEANDGNKPHPLRRFMWCLHSEYLHPHAQEKEQPSSGLTPTPIHKQGHGQLHLSSQNRKKIEKERLLERVFLLQKD